MDRKIVLTILGAALAGFFGVMLLMPASIDDGTPRLPWQTALDPAGRTRVFGFTLGETPLAEVRRTFGEEGEINLFETPGRPAPYAVEVYFEQIYLNGLRGNFVMTLDLDQEALAAMYERGLRISQVGSGSRRVKLDPEDAEILAGRPIRSIAYLPQAKLDEALVEKRFGPPSERRAEPETGVVHWLYPERGIDLARDGEGRIVVQYVNPADFDALAAPLAAPAGGMPPGS